jgi:hypothetical protein
MLLGRMVERVLLLKCNLADEHKEDVPQLCINGLDSQVRDGSQEEGI